MATNFGKHWIHFTEEQALTLGLGPKRKGGVSKNLILYSNRKGTFVKIYGKRVPVGRLPMSNHYHAEEYHPRGIEASNPSVPGRE